MRIDPSRITQQMQALLADYPELADDEDLRADMFEAETDLHNLLRQIEQIRSSASSLAGAAATQIAELEIRQKRFEKREQAMRDLALKIMQIADLPKLELPGATLSIRRVPPSVMITNEDAIPDIACKFVRKPDKTKIKELLQSGPVAGATMSNGAMTLSIRTR